jgi:hypothetical protein
MIANVTRWTRSPFSFFSLTPLEFLLLYFLLGLSHGKVDAARVLLAARRCDAHSVYTCFLSPKLRSSSLSFDSCGYRQDARDEAQYGNEGTLQN